MGQKRADLDVATGIELDGDDSQTDKRDCHHTYILKL